MNSDYLKNQIDGKRFFKNNKMTEQEWALNHKLLQKIKSSPHCVSVEDNMN